MEERLNAGWKHFPHAADIGVCGYGPSAGAAFEQAALALTAAVTSAGVQPLVRVDVACQGRDLELLFAAWLNAVIYEMSVRKMVFGRFDVQLTDGGLTARIWGEPVDRRRHEPACEPKGATYTALKVARDAQGRWQACCVIDV